MVEILYGKGSMTCPVEPNAVLTAHGGQEKAEISGSELVRQAMEAPIGSEPLFVLAKGKARAT
ncbi:MAG: lactate racemization operon protein LarA, partial [Oscillospiraceae bacterium]|nr:lactate racemization operon protein LarA [Oscillospiraceae bacterium]